MILINLLPHRELARKRRRDVFNLSLGLAALLGVLIAMAIFLMYQAAIGTQESKNNALSTEIKKLEEDIKKIEGLETEITALRARQQAVEDLQSDRNSPVHLLTEIVNQMPDGVYINKMVQLGQMITFNGVAQSNERVSELLRNLSTNTPWFSKPELVEITSGTVSLSPKDQRRVFNFVMKVGLVRSSELEKNATKADGFPATPASGASSAGQNTDSKK
jgi:type IV pilus assembly protein PilN